MVVRYIAYAFCVIQLIAVLFLLFESYSIKDALAASLLALLPIAAIFALRSGPDKEERLLRSQVQKARLRKELQELEGK